jgi:hypothetical protein
MYSFHLFLRSHLHAYERLPYLEQLQQVAGVIGLQVWPAAEVRDLNTGYVLAFFDSETDSGTIYGTAR